jgi:putative hemolysin
MNVFANVRSGDVWLLVSIALLLGVDGFLSAAESALGRTSLPKAAALASNREAAGRALVRLAEEPHRYVNLLLLLSTIVRVGAVFLVAVVSVRSLPRWGQALAYVGMVGLVFVLAEVLPKTWATVDSDRVALATARPVLALSRLTPLQPLARGLIGLANIIVPGKGLQRGPFVSEQELLGIVGAAVDDDVIEHEERELIASVLEFGDTVAREVMVPRPDMVVVEQGVTISASLDLAIEHGYSRLPVVGETTDDVVGIAYAKDMMRAERSGGGSDHVSTLSRPARFVPETKPLTRLMREMQAEKFHMVILIDEYGGVAGLVTLEDCLEELVGDIMDEYDNETDDVQELESGHLLMDGGTSIDDVNEQLGTDIPNEDWDTVGGFVFSSLGHVPAEGEELHYKGHVFRAIRMDGRRVSQVLVTRPVLTDHERIDAS